MNIVKYVIYLVPYDLHSCVIICHTNMLGGMHMLRNCIHATAAIMAGSGMKEVLARSFGSADNMLSGKKYPQTFYTLRMLVEELLCSVLQIKVVTSLTTSFKCLMLTLVAVGLLRYGLMILSRDIIIMNFSHAGHQGDCAGLFTSCCRSHV